MATAGNTVHKLQKFAYSTANNTMVHNTDVVVQGNLTVRGTQTYAQTQTLLVQDNIITLNAAINQSGVPIFDAGIEIDRGSEQNVALLWKESEGAWKFTNDGVNYETLGGGSAGSYANSAFAQANAAFASANNVAPQVQPAFDKANAAYNFANTTTAWGTRQTFVATAGQTVFNVGSGYLVGYIDVYYNGIKLYGGDDYTAIDGLSVTLTNPALVNDIIEVVGFGANVPVANIYVLNSTTSFLNRQTFFATANQTTFTPTQSYRVGFIDVYYNGLKMVIPDDVVANNGTTIEFVGLTPITNDVIEIVGLTPNVALANAIPITGGSVSGNLLPAATNTYYLGSSTNRWHSLFLGPASLDIDGLVLSNSGGTLSVTSSGGAPSTFIDTYARGHSNAAFQSANNVAPQVQPAFDKANAAFAAANSVNVYDANTISTGYFAVPIGNTAQKPASPPLGSLRYNTSNNALESYVSTGWLSVVSDTPSIQSVTPTTFNGNVGTTFTITGTNFKPDATVSFVTGNGSFVIAASVIYVNQTELKATTIRDFTIAEEPLGVRVSQSNGAGIASLVGVIDCGSIPTWNSSAGSLGTYYDAQRTNVNIQLGGYDAEDANANLVFGISSGALPIGLTLNANGAITGTPSAVAANTTNNFSVIITDAGGNESASRAFSFTILAPITLATYTYTGSDQTLTLPAGISSFKAHIWGGGGGSFYFDGSYRGGGGGYTTGTITGPAGASYTVVVGASGDSRGGNAGTTAKRYGGGGQLTGLGWGGQGGGLSGIFTGTGTVFSGATVQGGAHARSILIAGGGGGSGDYGWGGSGGGTSGRNVYTNGGAGVGTYGAGLQTDSNNGYDGASQKGGALYGGDAGGGDNGGGGGGGAGYYGGGGGTGLNSTPNSGGGGSGYIGGAPGYTVSNASTEQGTDRTPGGITSAYYDSSYAFGANGLTYATAGRVVITI